jgi:hypothetical protein
VAWGSSAAAAFGAVFTDGCASIMLLKATVVYMALAMTDPLLVYV